MCFTTEVFLAKSSLGWDLGYMSSLSWAKICTSIGSDVNDSDSWDDV